MKLSARIRSAVSCSTLSFGDEISDWLSQGIHRSASVVGAPTKWDEPSSLPYTVPLRSQSPDLGTDFSDSHGGLANFQTQKNK